MTPARPAGGRGEPAAPWYDLHNHVIPGVDDGAQDLTEALEAVATLRAQGVRKIVATPHLDGSLTLSPDALSRRLAELDTAWGRLLAALGETEAAGLHRGVELKLDVPEVDLADPRLRLGGGRTVLVEFPFMTVPPRSAEVLAALNDQGFQPLLAHPERYLGLEDGLALSWLEAGAFLQLNAGSLRGRYGAAAMQRARYLLGQGLGHCMASDFHARGSPEVAEARALLTEWAGEEQAKLLFDENPERLLRGEIPMAPEPVGPPRGRSALRRLMEHLPWA